MKSSYPTIAAAGLVVHLLAGCSENAPAPAVNVGSGGASASPAPIAAGKLVLAFGDSLYAGYGVLPQESFPAQLEQALRARGIAASVRNAGVSGDTTATGLARFAYALDGLERAPDLVVLGLGGNDMLRGLPPEQTRANLEAMLKALKRRGIPVLLTGMVAAPNLGADYGARFNAIYPELAQDYGAALYPFFLDEVVTDRALMQPDRIHPKREGIARVVERITPLVAEWLHDSPRSSRVATE